MKYYKFVAWDVPPIESVLTARVPQAIAEADRGNYKPLKEIYYNGGMDLQNPTVKISGYAFSLREYCRRYWVKTRYYGIMECYAPNKTAVYKNLGKYNVLELVEM